MKPSDVKKALKCLIALARPVFIWGKPGVGKSNTVEQIAQEMVRRLKDIRTILLDAVDMRGIPTITGANKAHWCIPDFLPTEGEGILFLDELNAAPPSVQAACYQLILDRKLGEYELPPGWSIVAAGNRETDRAVTHRMPSPLANRFVHLNFEEDVNDWVDWALKHNIMTEVIAFIRFRNELLCQFDPQKNEKAFPTPRSWEFVSDILKKKPEPEIEFELLAGTVGEGAAAELKGYLDIYRKIPNPDTILMNPDQVSVPSEPPILYAISTALGRKASDQTFSNIIKYANRMPDEFSVLLVKDSIRRKPDLVNSRAYIEWNAEHADVLV
jgi:MoxR-like ATPase